MLKMTLCATELKTKTMNAHTHTLVQYSEGLVANKAHFFSKDQCASGHLSGCTFSVVLFTSV